MRALVMAGPVRLTMRAMPIGGMDSLIGFLCGMAEEFVETELPLFYAFFFCHGTIHGCLARSKGVSWLPLLFLDSLHILYDKGHSKGTRHRGCLRPLL